MCIIAGAAFLISAMFGISIQSRADAFAEFGEATPARVVSRRISSDDDSDSYYVTFAFQIENIKVRDEKSVSAQFYRTAPIGSEKVIRYLPKNSRDFEHYPGATQSKSRGFQLFSAIAGLIGIGALWLAGNKGINAIKTRQYGERTTAVIVGFVERKNSGQPTGNGYKIFRSKNGVRGESLDHNIDRLRALGKSTEIVVYEKGNNVWWEGYVGPRKFDDSSIPKTH